MDIKKREFAEPEDSGFSATYDPLNGDSFHKRMKIERDGGGGDHLALSLVDGEEHIGPSAVVHCRGLPLTTTDAEITSLLSPYGRVESVCLLRKGQALIEMDSLQSSSNIIATNPITFQNQKIYFSYSKSQHLHNPKKTGGAQTPTTPSNILLCSILTPVFPISTSTLYTIMSPYGRVMRIVIFQKKGLQAFVEFETPYSAWVAKEALNGQDIYTGSCTLQIDYARVTTLNVKQNDDKTFDYTLSEHPGFPLAPPAYSPFAQPGAPSLDNYAKPAGPYMVMGAQPGATTTMGIPPYGMYSAAPGTMGIEPPSQTVIMVHRLADTVTSDQLFNLFCLYGNVIKIKMLQGAKSGAMVQMGDGLQADTAIHCLNGSTIFGQRLSIFHSKHSTISESDKTKDYTDSPLNRFTKGGIGSYKNIYKPSATIYFINAPTTFTEKDLTHLFINNGTHAPNNVKFFPPTGTKLMGLIEFSDVKSATEALMIVNNTRLDGNVLRLSFTINTINKTDKTPNGATTGV